MSFTCSLRAAFRLWAALGRFTKLICCVSVVVGATAPIAYRYTRDQSTWAPTDYGFGPGKPIGTLPILKLGYVPLAGGTAPQAAATAAGTVRQAGVNAWGGFFGPAFPWPIIPIHVALLPDGRVLSYGTDQSADDAGSSMVYDIWNPSLGTGSNAHAVLPNYSNTMIFCSAVTVLPSGNALVVGGQLVSGSNAEEGYSTNAVEIFNPKQNVLTAAGQMAYPRWYPSITTLPDGEKLVLGGLLTDSTGVPTPEVFSGYYGWRQLTGISIDPYEWYYPRAFVGPDGAVYVLQQNGIIFRLTTDGAGTLTDTGARLDADDNTLPSLMTIDAKGNPYTALMARYNQEVQSVDFSKNPPVVTRVGNLNYVRVTGQLTLLPNGQVFASGGSLNFNDLSTAVYQSEIYTASTGTWLLGATAAIPRLYHNSALLLPDGSVLTAGGGAPGPINELNAEIYYPPYLYLQDGSGSPAPRPTIVSAPAASTPLFLNQTFLLTVGANDHIGWINLIRVGADTHDFNSEQRLIPLPFTQSGTQITATLLASPELAPPGYYMLFVFNTAGVPAIAKIIYVW